MFINPPSKEEVHRRQSRSLCRRLADLCAYRFGAAHCTAFFMICRTSGRKKSL